MKQHKEVWYNFGNDQLYVIIRTYKGELDDGEEWVKLGKL